MKLFLDDLRNPPDDNWIVVRNEEAFKQFIIQFGVPDLISFDHDLGGEETGMNCAKWLVENNYIIKDFIVHSANPVGRANIEGLLNNWRKFKQNSL